MDKAKAISNFWQAYNLIEQVAIAGGETSPRGTIGRVDALLRFDGDQDDLLTDLSQAIERLKRATSLLEIVRYDVTVARSLAAEEVNGGTL